MCSRLISADARAAASFIETDQDAQPILGQTRPFACRAQTLTEHGLGISAHRCGFGFCSFLSFFFA
jgi:hypothetical protein